MIDIECIENPPLEEYEILAQGIRDHADEMRNIKGKIFGAFFAKEGDKIIGGVGFTVYLGALQIEKL